jgi:hypothetical protein
VDLDIVLPHLLYINTGATLKPNFYFTTRKFTTSGVCGCPDEPWGVLKTAGPTDTHDPLHAVPSTLCCPGPTMDGATHFLVLNFAQKEPGTTALALMHPLQDHSFLLLLGLDTEDDGLWG